MSQSVNVVNIVNIFREEEPDPQSGLRRVMAVASWNRFSFGAVSR